MNYYTKNGIDILNDTTKDLKNLDELGIYLAKQTNIDAIKSLKLLILAADNSRLDKDFDIDSVKTYTETFGRDKYKRNETIIGNLATNPQNLGLELMEYILHNYMVDLNVQPYDSGYTIFDFWARSFVKIEDDQDNFYKRYDMIDKKLDIATFMIQDNLLDINQLDFLLTSFDRCILRKHSYTKNQLLRMQYILNTIKLLESKQIKSNVSKDVIIKKMLVGTQSYEFPNKRNSSYDELMNYEILNNQCVYMSHTIPILVRKKIIK